MASLPTFTNLTSAQATRIQAAFAAIDTTKTANANYLAWLKDEIKNKVFQFEADQISEKATQDIQAKRKNVDDDLNNAT